MLTLMAPLGAILGLILLEGIIRRTLLGVACVLGLYLVQVSLDVSLVTVVGPVNVAANDVVFTLLALATVARLLRAERITVVQGLLILFGLVALVSLLRGALIFGPDTALNDFRKVYYLVSGALYCSTVTLHPTIMRRMGWLLIGTATVVLGLALLRWGLLFAGLPVGRYAAGGPLRVLDSGAALLLAQGFFIVTGQRRLQSLPTLLRPLVPLLLVAILLVQHRSVWIVTIVTLAVFATRDRQLGRRLVAFAVAGTLACIAVVVFFFDSDEFAVAEDLSDSATNPDTFAWRVEGWTSLFDESGPQNAADHLVGRPFGSSFERRVNGQVVDVSPHNYYLETYLRMGAVGLALLLSIGWRLWNGLSARSRTDDAAVLSSRVLLLLLVTIAVYYIPYHPLPTHGVIIGLIAAASSGRELRTERGETTVDVHSAAAQYGP